MVVGDQQVVLRVGDAFRWDGRPAGDEDEPAVSLFGKLRTDTVLPELPAYVLHADDPEPPMFWPTCAQHAGPPMTLERSGNDAGPVWRCQRGSHDAAPLGRLTDAHVAH
jgi:hypothetical protein